MYLQYITLTSISILFVQFFFNASLSAEENNVCQSENDYYTMRYNENCWYDFITDLELPEIVNKSGRPFEIHKVVTSDGHILSLFRIPNYGSANRKRSPVYLQHGMISSSKNWVSLGNDSLAFQLNDNGYDVWIGNYRGTVYSEEHVNLTVRDEEYWDYGIDELALIDVPTMLNKVMEVTGATERIIYIGHSLGGSIALMYASELPAKAKTNIKAMVLMAPGYKLSNITSPVRRVIPFIESFTNLLKRGRVLNIFSRGVNRVIRFFCLNSARIMLKCMQLFGYHYGDNYGIKPSQFPNFLKQQFSRSSIQTLNQIATWYSTDSLSKFDYGINNTDVYGQENVPSYNVSQIDVPAIIFLARNDWLTHKKDILQLSKDMNSKYVHKLIEVDDDNFNHMDYVFGGRSKKLIVDVILKHIKPFD